MKAAVTVGAVILSLLAVSGRQRAAQAPPEPQGHCVVGLIRHAADSLYILVYPGPCRNRHRPEPGDITYSAPAPINRCDVSFTLNTNMRLLATQLANCGVRAEQQSER